MLLQNISEQFVIDLQSIVDKERKVIIGTRKVIQLAQRTLLKMRRIVVSEGFKNTEEEIDFFKNRKQIPQIELLYQKQIQLFELRFPRGPKSYQTDLIDKYLKKCDKFFLNHIDFGQYLEMNDTYLDEYYFTLKENEKGSISYCQNYFFDLEFNTPADMLLAQFKAYGRFVNYLKERFATDANSLNEKTETTIHLQWVGSKIDLIELVYAIHASKSIEKGTGLKDVAKACERLFNIDLGNYYRKFIELRNRKMVERTQYIDKLKSSLIDRMNQADD